MTSTGKELACDGGENRRCNAADEVDRASVCLNEARTLLGAGMPCEAASQAYYVVFHGALRFSFSAEIEPRSHRGIVALVGHHFVKPGHLSPEMGRLLSRMQRDREDADYLMGAVFTDAEASEMVADAERYLDQVRRLLAPA